MFCSAATTVARQLDAGWSQRLCRALVVQRTKRSNTVRQRIAGNRPDRSADESSDAKSKAVQPRFPLTVKFGSMSAIVHPDPPSAERSCSL